MPLAAKASVLSAQVVPSAAGETEWADMRAAYDALDEATRRRIAGLSAYHSLYHSQAKIGHVVQTGAGYGFHTKGAPLRPLVKVHPVTGRPALFIGRHAYGITGLDEAESEKLLSDLKEVDYDGKISLVGMNEFFMHEENFAYLERIKKAIPRCLIQIYSNGDYLTREYLERAERAGVDLIVVSFHLQAGKTYNADDVLGRAFKFTKRTSVPLRKTDWP